jgi:hypothetical protein
VFFRVDSLHACVPACVPACTLLPNVCVPACLPSFESLWMCLSLTGQFDATRRMEKAYHAWSSPAKRNAASRSSCRTPTQTQALSLFLRARPRAHLLHASLNNTPHILARTRAHKRASSHRKKPEKANAQADPHVFARARANARHVDLLVAASDCICRQVRSQHHHATILGKATIRPKPRPESEHDEQRPHTERDGVQLKLPPHHWLHLKRLEKMREIA